MDSKEQLAQMIYAVLDDINETRAPKDRVRKALDTRLLGVALDSLGAVSLVVGLDERVQKQFGVSLDVISIMAIAPTQSPLQSVATLIDYVSDQVT